MTKPNSTSPKSEFTGKDAEALIATYGRAVAFEKKAKLMAQLAAERGTFETGKNRPTSKPTRERD